MGPGTDLSLQHPHCLFHSTWQLCSLDRGEHGQPEPGYPEGSQGHPFLGYTPRANSRNCPKSQNTSQETVLLPPSKPPLGHRHLFSPWTVAKRSTGTTVALRPHRTGPFLATDNCSPLRRCHLLAGLLTPVFHKLSCGRLEPDRVGTQLLPPLCLKAHFSIRKHKADHSGDGCGGG